MKKILLILLVFYSVNSWSQSIVLITGSNRGIGYGLVKEFADNGWKVIATCRKPENADDLKTLAANNSNIILEKLDVTDYKNVEALAEKLKGQKIDVLINNAGLLPIGEWNKPFQEMDFEYAREVFDVNSFAPVKMMQAFMNHIAASEQKKIINISSQAGSFANNNHEPRRYVYRASKASLNMFTFDIAYELGKMGITAIALHPGTVHTQSGQTFEEAQQQFSGLIRIEDSAAMIYQTIAGLNPTDNGKFFSYEGHELSW